MSLIPFSALVILISLIGPLTAKGFFSTDYLISKSQTPFSDCGSYGALENIEVIPCNSTEHCDLKRGTNVTFNIQFKTNLQTPTLQAVVHGVFGWFPIYFNFPQENACENSNITCPIQTEVIHYYSVQLPVLTSYPKVRTKVRWELKDEAQNDVICVEVPSRLV